MPSFGGPRERQIEFLRDTGSISSGRAKLLINPADAKIVEYIVNALNERKSYVTAVKALVSKTNLPEDTFCAVITLQAAAPRGGRVFDQFVIVLPCSMRKVFDQFLLLSKEDQSSFGLNFGDPERRCSYTLSAIDSIDLSKFDSITQQRVKLEITGG